MSFKYNPQMLPVTLKMLLNRQDKNISLSEIRRDTGLHERHLTNLQAGGVPNPTVKTIETLYQYLLFRGMNPKRYS